MSLLFLVACDGAQKAAVDVQPQSSSAVTNAVSVAISPSNASTLASQTTTFSATVSNTSNGAVTWSVQEGAAGGSIAPNPKAAPALLGHGAATQTLGGNAGAQASISLTTTQANEVVLVFVGGTDVRQPTHGNAGAVTVTDNQSNSWTFIADTADTSGSLGYVSAWYRLVPTPTTLAVTGKLQEYNGEGWIQYHRWGGAGGVGNSVTLNTPFKTGSVSLPISTQGSMASVFALGETNGNIAATPTSNSAIGDDQTYPTYNHFASTYSTGTTGFSTGTATVGITNTTFFGQAAIGVEVLPGATSTAVYTAPATAGTFHVVATSVADTTKSATATVTVGGSAAVAVAINPTTASVLANQGATFSATVTNTSNTAVTWSVKEGASGGSVTSSGVYTAPSTAGTYHVVATSVADTTKSATATVTVSLPAVAVSISPTTASVLTSGSKTFSATVTNTSNTAVTWSVKEGSSGGSVTSAGVYTAPSTAGSYHVIATSVADTTKSATATVTVSLPAAVAVSISPTTASVLTGGTATFSATVTNTSNTAVTWSVKEGSSGGSVTSAGVYTAPSTAGSYHVVATSVADTTKSATATVTVSLPAAVAVAISPTTASVLTSGSTTFSATVTNTSNTAVTWSVKEGSSGGSVTSAGVYTAPATAGTYHVVATSVADTSKSATATVTVTAPAAVAVTVSPKTATLSTGGSQTFTAAVANTSNTAVTWSVEEGGAGGTITSGGVYTAPASATTAHVIATSQADTTKSDTATVTVIVSGTTGVWTNVTPSGLTGVTDVVVDPKRPSNLYAMGNHGGVWLSTNYGLAWTKMNTGTNGSILDGGTIQGAAIATNPSNTSGPPALYVSCSVNCPQVGIYISTDGGVNWIYSPPGNTQTDPTFKNDPYGVAVDPTNANHVVIGMHGVLGLSETLNALAATPTWRTVITEGDSQGQSLFPFFINPSPAEASAGATISTTWLTQAQWDKGEGIWRTTNSGATWTHVVALDHPHGNAQLVDLGGGLLYAAGYPGPVPQGIYKSTDYGVTWTNVYNVAPEGGVVATPTRLYSSNGFAGAANPNLVTAARSSDTTWSSQATPSGMGDGWKRVSVTFDGTHYIIVGGFWQSGIWRYVE